MKGRLKEKEGTICCMVRLREAKRDFLLNAI